MQANGSTVSVAEEKEPDNPDPGLVGTHEAIKFLGRGGTGDTWLYKDRVTGEEVAIKLVKRPVPKVLQPNLLREIRVCLRPCANQNIRQASQMPMCPSEVEPLS